MMCQCNGLRLLEMGKAGHIGLQVIFHRLQDHQKQFLYEAIDLFHLFSGVELHIQSHLIVAAAAGVQLFACITDPVDEMCLHKAVNILIGIFINGQLPGQGIIQNPAKTGNDLISLRLCENLLFCEHCHMCDTALDILI